MAGRRASPGMSLVTFMDKKPGVSDEDFYRIWHGEHTPLTFEIHPFWLYVRNQVLRPITEGAPPVRAIVYEAVPDRRRPARPDPALRVPGPAGAAHGPDPRVDAHIDTFANRATLQCVTTREWIFKTLST